MALTREELGRRIRIAREGLGLTQEQLGISVDLPRLAIGQIESGGRSVSSIELDRIARVVGRDIKSFFDAGFEERDALSALFRSDLQFANQAELVKALQACIPLGRELTNLERLLDIDRAQLLAATYELPLAGSKWDAIQQGQRVAAEERQRLAVGYAPIGDLAELLESQGVRTGAVSMPGNLSGLMLSDKNIGVFIVINSDHAPLRQRFSLAHEYAHVLMDRNRTGTLSRSENMADLFEVRANAFAAEFLMPSEGVVQFVGTLGKGGGGRTQVDIYDGEDVVAVENRVAPGSQDIQLYDVALLSHHFCVSRTTMIYRLKNLRMVDAVAFQNLLAREKNGEGREIAELLNAPEPAMAAGRGEDFKRRFLGLALEAYRRDEITRGKLNELASLIGAERVSIDRALELAGIS